MIGIDDEDDSTFTITVDQSRSYYFQGDSTYLFCKYAIFHDKDFSVRKDAVICMKYACHSFYEWLLLFQESERTVNCYKCWMLDSANMHGYGLSSSSPIYNARACWTFLLYRVVQ